MRPVKHPKATPKAAPKVYPARDAHGRPFQVGQRVRYGNGEVATVSEIRTYKQWEIVYCRTADGDRSQPMPEWCTILPDATPKRSGLRAPLRSC